MVFEKFFVFATIFFVVPIESAKILTILVTPSPSHYIYGSALFKELATRGHEVTSVNTYPQKKPIKNFRDIFIESNLRVLEEFMEEAQDGNDETTWTTMMYAIKMAKKTAVNVFENSDFQELLKSPKGKFDLIIIENVWNDALYGLGQHFDAPMIGISTFGTTIGIDEVVGNTSPNSVVPNTFLYTTSHMSFWNRVLNFYSNVQQYLLLNYKNYYIQKALYHNFFPNAKLDYDSAIKNFSLLILNQHHSLSYPRPYVTNVIEAGGLHIKHNPDPLPDDLQRWLDNATEGVVYFSMGSNLKSKDFPPETRNLFLNVFRKLKQKVLWKFEDPELPNKPDNILIKPWLPQHSVLHHPNVKVFFTHGGLLSTTEAIFFGKPILGMPMLGDQPRNIMLATNRDIAISVDFKTLTERDLEYALHELLYNTKYADRMRAVSGHYHDQPLRPMETAVYWVEYILRHGDGAHLRNAGVDLNVFQYYSVDVVGFCLFVLLLLLITPIWLIKSFLTKRSQGECKGKKFKTK